MGSGALIIALVGGIIVAALRKRQILEWLANQRTMSTRTTPTRKGVHSRLQAKNEISDFAGVDGIEVDIQADSSLRPTNPAATAETIHDDRESKPQSRYSTPSQTGSDRYETSAPNSRPTRNAGWTEDGRDKGLVEIQTARTARSSISITPAPPSRSVANSIVHWFSGPKSEDVRFYGNEGTVRLNGATLESPLVYYVEGTLREPFDASLIESGLPVATSVGRYVAELPYWPSYRGCSPTQRQRYLNWLTTGRSAPDIELGYVFIFFYGLERRVLIDGEDHRAALTEVLRLLTIYQSSNSLRRYASSLLWMILLTAPDGAFSDSAIWELFSVSDYWTDECLTALLAMFFRQQKPLPVEVALLVAQHDPRSPRSVVTHRHEEKFRELFAQRYRTQFGEGIVLRASKQDARFEYRPASETLLHFWYDHPLRSIRLPNVLGLSSQFKPLVEVWTSTVEDLRNFDRAHRKTDGSSMTAEMYEALPPELRQDDHPDFDRWYAVLNSRTKTDAWTLVPISELATLRGISQRNRLTRKQCEIVLATADLMDLCVEPDARETGQNYRWDEQVSVFPREHEGSANLKSYHAASILLRLGLMVAAADGAVDPSEVAAVTKHLEQQFELSVQDSTRLEHLAYVLAHTGTNMAQLGKKLSNLPEQQRLMIGEFLVAVAAADEVVTPEEVRALRKVYRDLGLDPAALDSLAASRVRTADAAPETEDELVLNHDRIRQIMSETAKVADFLQSVMLDDENGTGEAVTEVAVGVRREQAAALTTKSGRDYESAGIAAMDSLRRSAAPGTKTFHGLDPRYHAFLECVLTKADWSREALEIAAREHRVMLGGAIERINEWSLEHSGDWLVDDSGDVIVVRLDLLDHTEEDTSLSPHTDP